MNVRFLFPRPFFLILCILFSYLCSSTGLAQTQSVSKKSASTAKGPSNAQSYSSEDLKILKQFTTTMRRDLRALEKAGLSKRPYTVEQALAAVSGPKTPASIFRWIVDNIGFEPYVGALRGPAGALIAGSANSADQALLLNAMLNKSGFTTRFVLGTIQDYDLTQTLYSFTGSARLAAPGKPDLLTKFVPEDYADRLQYAQLLSNHVWLEVQQPDGNYLPADPILAPLFGMTPAIAIARSDTLPDIFRANLGLQLVAQINDGQELTVLNITTPLDQYAYQTLSLGFVSDETQKNSVRPTLILDNQPSADRGEPFPSDQLKNLELRYTMKIGRRETRWNQTLYQKPTPKDSSTPATPDFSQQHFAISFIPGWTANDQLTRLAHQNLSRVTDQLNLLTNKKRSKDLSFEQIRHRVVGELASVMHFAYLRNLDRLTFELSNLTGVRPILQTPRVVTTAIARQNNEFVITLNLQGDTLESMPMKGIPSAAATGLLTLYGRIKNQLEGEPLTTTNTSNRTSIDSIFRQARIERIPFTTLHHSRMDFMDQLKVNAKTRDELKELTVDRGMILLLPTRPVLLNDLQHFGWWTLIPQNGALEGHYDRPLFSTQTTPTPPISEQLQNTIDLSTHLYQTVQQVLDDYTQKKPLICKASRDVRRLTAGMCATTKSQKMPTLKECLQPKTPAENNLVTAEGLIKFATPGCEQQLKETRCGAVITSAFLDGTLALAAPEIPPSSDPISDDGSPDETQSSEELADSSTQVMPYCP